MRNKPTRRIFGKGLPPFEMNAIPLPRTFKDLCLYLGQEVWVGIEPLSKTISRIWELRLLRCQYSACIWCLDTRFPLSIVKIPKLYQGVPYPGDQYPLSIFASSMSMAEPRPEPSGNKVTRKKAKSLLLNEFCFYAVANGTVTVIWVGGSRYGM
jgi:hypothetical protein